MVFQKKFFQYIRPGEFEYEGLQRLIREDELSLHIHHGFWHSMDTYADVDSLNKLWLAQPEWKVWRD
jgi:glucose-1-phosphate cytidylyltransferase